MSVLLEAVPDPGASLTLDIQDGCGTAADVVLVCGDGSHIDLHQLFRPCAALHRFARDVEGTPMHHVFRVRSFAMTNFGAVMRNDSPLNAEAFAKRAGAWVEKARGMALIVGTAVLLMASGVQGQVCCGDCDRNGMTSIDEIVNVVGGALGDCRFESTTVPLLASGQTIDHGAGSDGDIQAGVALSYRDNGDGTITDLNTGLMWEKKDDSTGIHDKDRRYTWCATRGLIEPECDGDSMGGTIVTGFLDTLNDVAGAGTSCFAGHCDWRVPNVRELQSIADYEEVLPATDSVFHQPDTCAGCRDLTSATCSCAESRPYWTSTSASSTTLAWFVDFSGGNVSATDKNDSWHARAVRGGL